MTPDELREAGGHLLVSRAVDRNDGISDALLDIAAGDQTEWTLTSWRALLRDLRRSRLKVRDWLDLNV